MNDIEKCVENCRTCGKPGTELCSGCQKIKDVHDAGPWNTPADPYRIVRYFSDGRPAKRIKVVSSLDAARLHCSSPLTSGTLRSGVRWFDGFKKIRGADHA